MRKHIASFVVVLCMTFVCTYSLRAETIDLFVLAGQSNMVGNQGNASGYPADPKGLDKKVRFYWVTPNLSSSEGKWTHLQPQGGLFPSGHFGPEITFARELFASGYNPAVFKYSLGGTSLAGDWKSPGENGMYDQMVAELKKAIKQLSKQGHTVKLRAFIWIQGESDAQTKELAEAYGDRLKTLIQDFRVKVAKNPDLLFILGVDEQYPWMKLNPQVVTHQKRLAIVDASVTFTSMEGLEKADSTHLTPVGLQAHGKRLFAAFMKLSRKDHRHAPADVEKPRR